MTKYFAKAGLKNARTILKTALAGFWSDRAFKHSASLAYYTILSLAPMLLLMIWLVGIFLGKDAAQGKVFAGINGLIGSQSATQIQDMIKHLESSGKSATSVIIGAITLLIGATTVFLEIQDSINMIWKVKVKPELGWAKLIRGRLLSSTLIVTVGFLMMVSLIVNGALMALSDMLTHFFPVITVVIFNILGIVLSFIITAMLFGVIYKVLPDVKVGWRDVGSGAIFTAVLFTIGRLGMSVYLEKSGAGSPYGAAGALIVILLWIYYTAAILYFGAEFTRAYADFTGAQIEPADYAVHVEEKEAGKTNVVSGEDKEEKNSQATTI